MTRYVAFLRTDPGGRNPIVIEDLRQIFFSIGFGNIGTFKATSNIIFDSSESDAAAIEQKIRRELGAFAGREVDAFVRTMDQMVAMSKANPFRTVSFGGLSPYVAFLSSAPSAPPAVPVESPRKDVRIFLISGTEAYCLLKKVKGKAGFPNEFVESSLGVQAVLRDWDTVRGIADLPK